MRTQKMRTHRWPWFGLYAIVIAAACLVLNTNRTMSPVWYAPYFSAAANLDWGGPFLVNIKEVEQFKEEMDPEARYQYRFVETENLTRYNANPIGFAYFIAFAKRLFWMEPDLRALQWLQISLHVLLCVLVLSVLSGPACRSAFLLAYAVNPIVIYFVTYPYYYFYQALPSFALVLLLLTRDKWPQWPHALVAVAFACAGALLALVLITRPTTIGAIAAFFVIALWSYPARRWLMPGIVAFGLIAGTGHSPTLKNVWHTVYIGIGAYPNGYMVGLSDDNGLAMFESRTGIAVRSSLGGNMYDDEMAIRYRDVARAEYMRILAKDWPMLSRNAIVNSLQGYSIGYIVNAPLIIHYAVAALGFVVLMALTWARQFVLIALIGMTVFTFSLYFPPIPAYMYGAYLLLVFGMVRVLQYAGITAAIDRRLGCLAAEFTSPSDGFRKPPAGN